MYLFSRRARLAPGNSRAAIAWATEVTEKANQISGLTIGLFALTYSPEVGSLSWSTFVPDLPTLEAAFDKLLVDEGYVSLVDAGAKFAQGGADDALLQIIHGEVDPNRQVEYATTVQTVCATGAMVKGVEIGIEIAKRAEKITGIPVLVGAGATGPYGSLGWISGYENAAALEASQNALAADAKFGDFIDKSTPGVYTNDPSQTQQLIYRRLV